MEQYQAHSSACNICGGVEFGPGPGGRSSRSGHPPFCNSCRSLERHRTARAAIIELWSEQFAKFDVLQISQDRCVEPDWFAKHYVSIYGTETSLDLQDIHRPTGTYDLVICNHVLEHVADDRAALVELTRVIKDDGFVFLTFPDPANRATTTDWGFPREDQHGHYRMYGRDVEDLFRETLPHKWVICQNVSDPVTGVGDLVYLLAKTDRGVARLLEGYPDAEVICRPTNAP